MKAAGILIADDHALVRRGIRATLAGDPRWQIVAEAENGQQAVELAAQLRPDVAILDLTMPALNGLDAARAMLVTHPQLRVLMLTVHETEQLIREVFRAGARGYLLKSDAGADLIAAVEALLDGRLYFTSRVARVVLDGFLQDGEWPRDKSGGGPLSPRERQVLQLLAEGRTNKDIARELDISVKTAETHRSNIMRKMAFGSYSELVRYAVKNGLVQP